MVTPLLTGPDSDPEWGLAITYAPIALRPGLIALRHLDDRLAGILRTTREPLVGQMRLTWWHEALSALDTTPPPNEPILQALARHVLPHVSGLRLADLVVGWEALLEPVLDGDAMQAHARHRGEGLFAAMAAVVGVEDPAIAASGAAWAFADLARHLQTPAAADLARQKALAAFDQVAGYRWPVPARAIGALAQIARLDLTANPRPAGHPARAARLLWLRVTGR